MPSGYLIERNIVQGGEFKSIVGRAKSEKYSINHFIISKLIVTIDYALY